MGMDLCDYLDAASKKTKQVKFSRQVLRDLGRFGAGAGFALSPSTGLRVPEAD